MEPDDLMKVDFKWDDNNKNLGVYTVMADWVKQIRSGVNSVATLAQKDGKLYLRTKDKDVELNTNNPTEIGELIVAEYAKQVLDNDAT